MSYDSVLNGNYQREKFYIGAMYTVEMSILFPIILFTLVGGIYIAFYVHDMTVTRAIVNKYSNQAAGQEIGIHEFEKEIYHEITKHTILGKVTSVTAAKNGKRIKVKVTMNYSLFFRNMDKNTTITADVNEINCPDYLRKVQVLADELKELMQ